MSDAVLKDWHLQQAVSGRRPNVARLGLALAAILAIGFVVGGVSMLPGALVPAPAPPVAAPRPVWIDIQKPVPMFNLEAPLLGGLSFTYSARRGSLGEGREDVLAFGTLAGDAPAIRLELARRGAGRPPGAPLFAALARQAADDGLSVERSGLPDLMATRFGTFEIADLTLTRPVKAVPIIDKAGAPSPCSGFRLVLGTPALSMTGLACGAPGHPISHDRLACLIDRLDLASAAGDSALIAFFAATELARNPGCAGMALGPDKAHAAWLDDAPHHDKGATSRKSLRRR